jgi:DNA-binding NarL/FixJ family response regulator
MIEDEVVASNNLIRVQVIEPQQITLWGICHLINSDARFKVCASSTNEIDALHEAEVCKPHVVLIEPELDSSSILNLIESIIHITRAKVLLLCSKQNSFSQEQAILKGARGIVLKNESPETLLKAIEKIAQGELWLNRNTTSRILERIVENKLTEKTDNEEFKLSMLTPREQKIAEAIQHFPKKTLKEIAQTLHISEHTLRNHLASIYDKLEVKNRLELYLYCGKYQKTQDPQNHPKRRSTDV